MEAEWQRRPARVMEAGDGDVLVAGVARIVEVGQRRRGTRLEEKPDPPADVVGGKKKTPRKRTT